MSRSPIDAPFGAVIFLTAPPPRAPLDRAAVGHLDAEPMEIDGLGDAGAAIAALQPVTILASDLRRDAAVADRLGDATRAPVAFDRRLRDRSFGAWEGRTWTDLVVNEPAAVAFLEHFDTDAPPGGESTTAVAARAGAPIRERLTKKHRQTIAVVAAPTVVRAVLAEALGLPHGATARWRLDPLSTTGLRFEGRFATLAWVNRFGTALF